MNTKIIKLDINNKMYETISAKQGDTESRFLLFHLFDASLPFDLTEKSVRVYGIKPDGTKIFNDLVINDVKKGYCTLKLTNQMLAIAGLVKLELVIYSGNKKLSSIPFMLNVISSLNSDDAVVSTNEFTSLMNGLAALSEYDIYKSNAKQVPGIKEEVSNLSSQLDTNMNKVQTQIDNLVLNASESKEVVYNNLFYNESYSVKNVNTTYSYQAFGTPVSFEPGKYLVYFNFNVEGTIDATINVGMTADTGTFIGTIDQKKETINQSTNGVIVYAIVDLTSALDIRPILNIKNNNDTTPDVNIIVNNLFVTKLENVDENLINELSGEGNVRSITVKTSVSDNEIVQARGNHTTLNGRITEIEDNIESIEKTYDNILKINETNYNNLFYNESYPAKTINSDYPYAAFGAEKSFEAGKYLVYFNCDFEVNFLNAIVTVGVTSNKIFIGDYDNELSSNPLVNKTTNNVISYSIVDLTEASNIRPLLFLRHKDTSNTPNCVINVNNCFICKLEKIDMKLIEELDKSGNIENITLKSSGINFDDYVKKEDLNEANETSPKIIDCWGDSLTYGVASSIIRGGYVTRLKNKLGNDWAVNNFGVGGEKTKTIACRQGGMNFVVQPDIVIPSNIAPVEIKLLADDGSPIQCRDTDIGGINPCYINGVEGTLSIDYGTFTKHFFTRKNVGDEIVINRPVTLVTANKNRKGNVNIIWMGQNGEKHEDHSGWDSEDDLVNQIRKMVEVANTDRYLILGLHTKDLTSRKLLEEKMYSEFGIHYINLRKYLSSPIYDTDGITIKSSYGLDDVGFTATDDDKRFIGMGYCPPSLLTDGVHGKDEFFDVITKLVYDRGNELGYW